MKGWNENEGLHEIHQNRGLDDNESKKDTYISSVNLVQLTSFRVHYITLLNGPLVVLALDSLSLSLGLNIFHLC